MTNLLEEESVPFIPQDDLLDARRKTGDSEDMHEERPTSASEAKNAPVSIGKDLLASVTDVKLAAEGHIEQILDAKVNAVDDSTLDKSLPSGSPSEGSQEEQTSSASEAKNTPVSFIQASLTSVTDVKSTAHGHTEQVMDAKVNAVDNCILDKSLPSGSPSEDIHEEQTASASKGTNAPASITEALLPSAADDMPVAVVQSKGEEASHSTQTYEETAVLSATENLSLPLNDRIADIHLNSTSNTGSLYDVQTATADAEENKVQRFCDKWQNFLPGSLTMNHPEILCKHEDQPLNSMAACTRSRFLENLEVLVDVTSSSSETSIVTRRNNMPLSKELQEICHVFQYLVHHHSRTSTTSLLKEESVPFIPQDDLLDARRKTGDSEDMHEERPTSASEAKNVPSSIDKDLMTSVTDVKLAADGHVEQMLYAKVNAVEDCVLGKNLPFGIPSEDIQEEQTTSASVRTNAPASVTLSVMDDMPAAHGNVEQIMDAKVNTFEDCNLDKNLPSGSPSEDIQEEQTASASEGTNAPDSVTQALLISVADGKSAADRHVEQIIEITHAYIPEEPISSEQNKATSIAKESVLNEVEAKKSSGRAGIVWSKAEKQELLQKTKPFSERKLTTREWEEISKSVSAVESVPRTGDACRMQRLKLHRSNSDAINTSEKNPSAVSYNCKREVDTNCDTGSAEQKSKTSQVRDTGMGKKEKWKNERKKAERRLNCRRINGDATNTNEKNSSAVSYNCKREVDTNCDTGSAEQKSKTSQVRDTGMGKKEKWKNDGKKAERRLNCHRINSVATNTNEKKTSTVSYNCKRKVDTNSDAGNAGQKPKTIQVRDTRMDWTPLEKKTLLKERAKYRKKATRDNWEQIANAVSAVGPLKRSMKAVSVSMVEAFLSIFVKFSLSPFFTFFFLL